MNKDYTDTTIRFDNVLYEKLRKASFDRKITMSEIVRQAVDLFFERERKNENYNKNKTK
jgi:predicted transcriptional regulator